MLEAVNASETSVNFFQTTRHYTLEERRYFGIAKLCFHLTYHLLKWLHFQVMVFFPCLNIVGLSVEKPETKVLG